MFKASPSEKSDAIINDVVRNNLFKNRDGIGGDLAARNIQRGRDHGLAPFRTYRESVCGLSGEPSWQYGVRKTNLILDHLYGDKVEEFRSHKGPVINVVIGFEKQKKCFTCFGP